MDIEFGILELNKNMSCVVAVGVHICIKITLNYR